MSFKYPYTCPDINQKIADAREALHNHLDDIVCELNPLFYSANNGSDKYEFIKGWVDSIYSELESIFEEVRETNIQMRKEAENQIDELECVRDELADSLNEARSEIERLHEA